MADTKQLTIMKRLTELLQGITPGNGYDYDLSSGVFRGRSVISAETVLPCVTILESLRPDPEPSPVGAENMERSEDWELLIQGWAKTSIEFPTDELYQLKGAIEKRLARMVAIDDQGNPAFPDDYRLGRIIVGARIGPGIVRPMTPQTGGSESLYLPVTLIYTANVSDPYDLS